MPNPEPLIEIFDDASPTGMRLVLHHRRQRRDLAGFRCRGSSFVTAIDRIDLVVCLPVLVVLDAVCLTLGVTRTLIQVIQALAGCGAA